LLVLKLFHTYTHTRVSHLIFRETVFMEKLEGNLLENYESRNHAFQLNRWFSK